MVTFYYSLWERNELSSCFSAILSIIAHDHLALINLKEARIHLLTFSFISNLFIKLSSFCCYWQKGEWASEPFGRTISHDKRSSSKIYKKKKYFPPIVNYDKGKKTSVIYSGFA